MKSKKEKKLDEEFERMGVRPRIYHFRDVHPFSAITVVTDTNHGWKDIKNFIWQYTESNQPNRATRLLEKLATIDDIHGVAICDRRDQFNRALGRIIAKGRLLKSLKEQK